MKIFFSRQARRDLQDLREFIAERDADRARSMVRRIQGVLEMLARGTVEGRSVALRDGQQVRSWLVNPYKVYYHRTAEGLEVVRIYHQSRRPLEEQPSADEPH